MASATTASISNTGATAPWRPLFQKHLSLLPSPEFVLSTLSLAPPNSPTPYLPRARYCIYRGMWASLPENAHNKAAKNPPLYDSDMLTFTTDARMEKVGQLFATGLGKGEEEEGKGKTTGTGGGGPVEAVFWIKDATTQWRFRGHAYVLAAEDLEAPAPSSTAHKVKQHLLSRMHLLQPSPSAALSSGASDAQAQWSFPLEISAHFSNLSPLMRGSFKNPAPGTPVGRPVGASSDGHSLALAQQVTAPLEQDTLARQNFRVVVICPEEVEQLEFSDPEKARRWSWTYIGPGRTAMVVQEEGKGEAERVVGDGGEWKMEELWP